MIWRSCCAVIWISLLALPASGGPKGEGMELHRADRPLIRQIYTEGNIKVQRSISPLGYVRYRLAQVWKSLWERIDLLLGGSIAVTLIQHIAMTALFLLFLYILYVFLKPYLRSSPVRQKEDMSVQSFDKPTFEERYREALARGDVKRALLLYTHHFIQGLADVNPDVRQTMTLRECARVLSGGIPAALLTRIETALYTAQDPGRDGVNRLVAAMQEALA